jgi:hypothetical protein
MEKRGDKGGGMEKEEGKGKKEKRGVGVEERC